MRVKLTILDRNPPASVWLSIASPTTATSLSMEVASRNHRTTLAHSLSEGEGFTIRKVNKFYNPTSLRLEPSPKNQSFAWLNLIFYPLPKRGASRNYRTTLVQLHLSIVNFCKDEFASCNSVGIIVLDN